MLPMVPTATRQNLKGCRTSDVVPRNFFSPAGGGREDEVDMSIGPAARDYSFPATAKLKPNLVLPRGRESLDSILRTRVTFFFFFLFLF